MVTASEGSPRRVTSRPLTSPQTTPSRTQSGMIVSIAMPPFQSLPMTAPARPAVEPTDRSISPETTSRVIGSAIRAIGRVLPIRKYRFSALPKLSTRQKEHTSRTTSSAPTTVSQRSASRSRTAPPGVRPPPLPVAGARRSVMVGAPCLCGPPAQQRRDPQRHHPVHRDGEQQQDSVDGLHPYGADADGGQHTVDRGEQQRAERGAVEAAGAAGEGDAADHHGADDGEFVAGAGAGVDVAEAGEVQRSGQPGERAAGDVRGQDP